MEHLTKNFTREEFACKCGCGLDTISIALVELLQLARDKCPFPFRISSGCRCQKHNKSVGGKPDSAHQQNAKGICTATDILFDNGFQLFVLINALLSVGFRRIGINFKLKFIHVDIDETKPQDTIFSY